VRHQTGAYFENLLKWKSGTSSGLRQLVRLFHSWFWICPDLSLKIMVSLSWHICAACFSGSQMELPE